MNTGWGSGSGQIYRQAVGQQAKIFVFSWAFLEKKIPDSNFHFFKYDDNRVADISNVGSSAVLRLCVIFTW